MAALAALCWATAAEGAVQPRDLTEMSLEELGEIQVTSVSRKRQSIASSAAAIFVVTAEDIRRSGALSIPEALRFVPGVEVARVDANQWAVSVRGFNGLLSNKLLVLIDGRTIYTPLFSGVHWDMHDLPMEMIERIEVIRGPGATMWGANAVNGVINVITKKAGDTAGGSMRAGFGSQDGPTATARYGGAVGGGRYRIYARRQNRRASPATERVWSGSDPWRSDRGGFRFDLPLGERDELQIQGDVHQGAGRHRVSLPPERIAFAGEIRSTAGNVLTRWTRTISERSDLRVQAYYDGMARDEGVLLGYRAHTFDAEFQHRIEHSERWETTWGGGVRQVLSRLEPDRITTSPNARDTFHYNNAFIQEEIQIRPDELAVTAGMKLEHTTLGGWMTQPSIRLIWTPNGDTALWAAVARAPRTPSWAERILEIGWAGQGPGTGFPGGSSFGAAATETVLSGGRNETLTAYESGFRFRPLKTLSVDVATFYNRYGGLRSLGLQLGASPGGGPPDTIRAAGSSYGAELAATWRAGAGWRVTAAHSYFKGRITPPPATILLGYAASQSPTHRTILQSSRQLRRGLRLDLAGSYVSSAQAGGVIYRGEETGSRFRGDAQLEWTAGERWRLSAGVQNLGGPRRAAFQPEAFVEGGPRARNVFLRGEWLF